MTIERFGEYRGTPVLRTVLRSETISLALLSYGGVVQSWEVNGPRGPMQATLGFDTFAPYPEWSRSFGIIAGRLANRVHEGRLRLDGETYQLDRNEGRNHLHGGSEGLGRQLWSLESDGRTARLALTSPDGAMGYPGTVHFTVDVTVDGPTVTFDMTGVPDRPTPIALAQHSYYALGGPVADHVLHIAAHEMTVTDAANIPTGEIMPVAGTEFDFMTPRAIGEMELDDNFCLAERAPAATLEGRDMTLVLSTDRPGLQVYNAFDMPEIPVPGLGGALYGPLSAIALEAQDWPDAVNHEHFPGVIATPEFPYRQTTSITIIAR
ncbi:aldose epimerase family protein [Acuticoccus sediminis]|uniref:aldose epimerase family protein n=1 Tax=Acuticoccus sediminis TaxID=2184697 RepID=UPI001CFEF161|nr:aldose epimerase family protein [Acuticoccus sediminis]